MIMKWYSVLSSFVQIVLIVIKSIALVLQVIVNVTMQKDTMDQIINVQQLNVVLLNKLYH